MPLTGVGSAGMTMQRRDRVSLEPRAEIRSGSGTLVSQLADTLRQAIAAGQFAPGARLPSEAQLTEAHGVSRTVVREAIASLRADRLVEARQGAGVFVLEPRPGAQQAMLSLNHIDLAQVSSMIELLELRTAGERRRKRRSLPATMPSAPVWRPASRPARPISPSTCRSPRPATIPASANS